MVSDLNPPITQKLIYPVALTPSKLVFRRQMKTVK